MRLMTFLSDFGNNSSYVSQMKGIALNMTDATLIDITHNVSPHNIREGAFVLKTSVPYFPTGTVHVAVVDPGVGTARRGIVVATKTQILVGPDNGLLIPAARELGNFQVYEIKNPGILSNSISNTFHGRDVFTPVAAHILNGLYFRDIGPMIKDYVDLHFGTYEITPQTATGNVIYIDSFGNIITNIHGYRISNFLQYGKKLMLFIGDKQVEASFVRSYSYVNKGDFLTTIGSSNHLEISVNQGNAGNMLNVKPGDELKILLG